MEQNFELVAQSRANYYTKGSPVQFVRVELLKGETTGEIAVCLTFKNVAPEVVSGLAVNFRCKNPAGEVLCEAQYRYEGLYAAQGELFGAEDAVYVSEGPVGSVDVELSQMWLEDGTCVPLDQYKRVRLPAPKALPQELARRLKQKVGGETDLKVAPQMMESGWYCACGAFHPTEEGCVWCSECGNDRILLQNALSNLLQQGHSQAAAADEPTRVVTPGFRDENPTRVVTDLTEEQREALARKAAPAPVEEDDSDMKIAPPSHRAPAAAQPVYEEPEDEEDEAEDPDETARAIIRWAPPIALVLCAIIALAGYLWVKLFV